MRTMRHAAVLSDLELRILGLIRGEEQSGYAIRKSLAASPGAIYPAIRRMAAAGLIAGKIEATGARRRETLQLTPAGRRALRDSLAAPAIEEVRRDPDGVAARLRFLDEKAAAAFLEEYGRICGVLAAERKSGHGLLADYEASIFTARARWAASAIKRIKSG